MNYVLKILKIALQRRGETNVPKICIEPIAAYDYQQECQTLDELDSIEDDRDRIFIETLLIRERIALSRNDISIVKPLQYYGDLLVRRGQFEQGLNVWIHMFYHDQRMNMSTILHRFVWLFCRMLRANENIPVEWFLKVGRLVFEPSHLKKGTETAHNAFFLVIVATKILEQEGLDHSDRTSIYCWVKDLCRCCLTTVDGKTLLHLCVDAETGKGLSFRPTDTVLYLRCPNKSALRLLLACGGRWLDLDAVEYLYGNTPLHLICRQSNNQDILELFLKSDCHTDCVNKDGLTPLDFLDDPESRNLFSYEQSPLKLKCLCARLIANERLNIDGLNASTSSLNRMIGILNKFLHLFFIINFGVRAAPIEMDSRNSSLNAGQRAMLSEYHINKLPDALRLSQAIPKFQAPKKFNLSKIANDLKQFGIDSLKDEKHLEGLPLDRDGKINPDFHKEIFLGNHELFEDDIQHDENRRNKKLEEIFNHADGDHNQKLSQDELLNYVLKNVNDHLKEAKDKNTQLFVLIDTNQDGKVTWHEYFALYVKFHKVNSTEIKETDTFDFVQGPFDNNFQRELVKIRFRWTEADVGGDNELDIDEFLAFRHPEIAGSSYKHIVDDLMLQMDRDDDQKLNETEFAFLPSSVLEDGGNKEWVEMDKRWLEDQKREFHEMDENSDGVLTKDELIKAYDPMNRVHINNQIKKLFSKVDDSPKDDLLSLEEIQKHADVFTDMKILDTEKALHDEI